MPDIKYASFSKRLLAAFLDVILLTLIVLPVLGKIIRPPVYIQELSEQYSHKLISDTEFVSKVTDYMQNSGGYSEMLMNSLYQILAIAVLTILFWHYKSATPGKMLTSLKIVDEQTLAPLSLKQQIIRYLGYFVSAIPLLLGFFWVLWNPKKQAWHDMMAGTIVIDEKKAANA